MKGNVRHPCLTDQVDEKGIVEQGCPTSELNMIDFEALDHADIDMISGSAIRELDTACSEFLRQRIPR